MGINLFGKKSSEDKFWKWFEKNQSTYYEGIENLEIRKNIFDKLSSELNKVHEGLSFEFSPIHENKIREFTISAEGIKDVFPIVKKLIEKAPKLENWKFYAFRQRIPGDNFEIEYEDVKIGYSYLFFRFGHIEEKIGLELNIRNFDERPETQNAIYLLLDGLIGEYDVTMGIKWIEWIKLDEENIEKLYPITHLRKIIDKKKYK